MHAIDWFEIPATDFDRAVTFYETVLAKALRREIFAGMQNAVLPYDGENGVGGAIVHGEHYLPAPHGPVVYLHVADLEEAVSRIPSAGGQVIMPPMSIGPNGTIAHIRDTEGNRVGLHQPAAQ